MDMDPLSPNSSKCGPGGYVPPSRTHEYKKLMKPLMERKRRARMNLCIEEIRDLISGQLSGPGPRAPRDDDLVSRMDKAEVLELAVKHIHKQLMSSRRPDPYTEVKMFHQGYMSARAVINDYLQSSQETDPAVLHRLNSHLDRLVAGPTMAPLAAPLRVLPPVPAPLAPPLVGPLAAPPPRPPVPPPAAAAAAAADTSSSSSGSDQEEPAGPSDGPINLSKSASASAFRPVVSKAAAAADPNSWRPW
ncbi:Enhancer of split mgamma protein [Amphibalanus amphitrite]|uniref:Enhancer of split mgamma protein n=2 Tax=Amphibalanus amphitrite TaxID=1232801 RepID=A0A6A4W3T9_AMPAM|nr:transcription factor HES-2-like [Amphibalanus amphitrite]KAF0296511.1 Enhancer of split mgamma protein [Amphibalanus amphitrite]